MKQRKVKISNISQNAADHRRLMPFIVYAEMYDAKSGEFLIGATLEYILYAIIRHKYTLVDVAGCHVKQSDGIVLPVVGDTHGA